MKSTEMRALGVEEMLSRVGEWEEQVFRYRCELKTGQLENTNLIRRTRQDIARAKTIMREKEHAGSQP